MPIFTPQYANKLIEHYALQPHPEGGMYTRSYCSAESIPAHALPSHFSSARYVSTAILFLLRAGEYSHLHKIQQDEMWHFYLGGTLRLIHITPHGAVHTVLLGHDVLAGHCVQYVVPAGHWFGATPCSDSVFSFVGCTVAPGFDFADFTLGSRAQLKAQFPAAASCIHEFCVE